MKKFSGVLEIFGRISVFFPFLLLFFPYKRRSECQFQKYNFKYQTSHVGFYGFGSVEIVLSIDI